MKTTKLIPVLLAMTTAGFVLSGCSTTDDGMARESPPPPNNPSRMEDMPGQAPTTPENDPTTPDPGYPSGGGL